MHRLLYSQINQTIENTNQKCNSNQKKNISKKKIWNNLFDTDKRKLQNETHQSNPNLGDEPNLDCPIPIIVYKKILVKFEPKLTVEQISHIIYQMNMCSRRR